MLSERHQRVTARSFEDIVTYDYRPAEPGQKPGKVPIPAFMEHVLRDTLRTQDDAARVARAAMAAIDARVEGLEQTVLARKEM